MAKVSLRRGAKFTERFNMKLPEELLRRIAADAQRREINVSEWFRLAAEKVLGGK